MGAAGFHNALILRFQTTEGGNQNLHRRQHLLFQCLHRRDVHGGGEGIVGGLAHVDVVVGMEQLLSRCLVAPSGDDLVGVHVGLGAGAGLPHHQREIVIELSVHDLLCRQLDGCQLLLRQLFRLQGMVGPGSGQLQSTKGPGDLPGHGFQPHPNGEILVAPLGLRPPVFVRGHLHFPHRVVFNAIFHGIVSFIIGRQIVVCYTSHCRGGS